MSQPTQPTRRSFTLRLALLVGALVSLAHLAPASAHASTNVVTTTEDLASIVREVGGNRVQVESICRGNEDPHVLQARPSYMVKLNRADLLIAVGLELEVGWLPALIQGARNPKINPGNPGYLDASSAIRPIGIATGPIDRSQGDVHPLGNPHYWLDPANAKPLAKRIASALAAVDPSGASTYEKNRQAFDQRIDSAMQRWTSAMAPFRGARIVSYHSTFDYFFHRFGLQSVGTVEARPGIPPSASHVAQLIARMQRDKVRVIFHETFVQRATSDLVARKAGAKVLVLPTSVGGAQGVQRYEQLIDHLVRNTVAALQAARS